MLYFELYKFELLSNLYDSFFRRSYKNYLSKIIYNIYNIKTRGFCLIIKNEIFYNFCWFICENSYFTKNELLLTPNIKDEDATIINIRFSNFMLVWKCSRIKNSGVAKFIIKFIDEYNEEKKFDNNECDEQKNIYDLIIKKNLIQYLIMKHNII